MKLKYYATALIPACLVVFMARAVELILSIDPRTGHFSTGTVIPMVFNLLLVLAALFFCTVLFAKREPKPAVVRLYRASMTDTVFGIGAAVFLLAGGLYRLLGAFLAGDVGLDKTLLTFAPLWHVVVAVLAAIFLIFFVTYPKRSAKKNLWRVMSLALTVYYVFLLLDNFRDLDVVFSHAFGIYLITFYGLAALASVNFSKILARLFGRKTFILFTCLMTVLLAVRLADVILFLIPGNPYSITTNLLLFCSDACVTVLFLSQMKKLTARKKKKPLPVADQSSAEETVEPIPVEESPEQPEAVEPEPEHPPVQETLS